MGTIVTECHKKTRTNLSANIVCGRESPQLSSGCAQASDHVFIDPGEKTLQANLEPRVPPGSFWLRCYGGSMTRKRPLIPHEEKTECKNSKSTLPFTLQLSPKNCPSTDTAAKRPLVRGTEGARELQRLRTLKSE